MFGRKSKEIKELGVIVSRLYQEGYRFVVTLRNGDEEEFVGHTALFDRTTGGFSVFISGVKGPYETEVAGCMEVLSWKREKIEETA